jgi:hypothetical protein
MNAIMLFVARLACALLPDDVRELAKGTWLGAAPQRFIMDELVEPVDAFTAGGRDVLVWRRSSLGDELLRMLGVEPILT